MDELGIEPRPDSYELPALTTVLFVQWSGVPVSNRVIFHGKEGRKPSRTRRILVDPRSVELR